MKLRFPANMPLLMSGVIRCRDDGFVLEMNDLDRLQQPVLQPIPLARSDAAMQAQLEAHRDRLVTLRGRWQPSPQKPAETGFLQVTAITEEAR